MAVLIVKKALTLTTLVKRLYKPEESAGGGLYDKVVQLEAGGCTLAIYPNMLQIMLDGGVLAKYTGLKWETVTLAMKDKLGGALKHVIKDKVDWFISNAYQKYLDNNLVVSSNNKPPLGNEIMEPYREQIMNTVFKNGNLNKVAGIKELRMLTNCSLKQAKDVVEDWIDYYKTTTQTVTAEVPLNYTVTEEELINEGGADFMGVDPMGKDWSDLVTYPGDLMKDKPVKLSEATKLHQPTVGTDDCSRYHVIALGDSVAVAARITENNKVSLRVELREHPNTKGSQKAKTALLAAGLEKKPQGHYSLHLDPTDKQLAIQSVGAILHGIDLPFTLVTGNLQSIVRVGK